MSFVLVALAWYLLGAIVVGGVLCVLALRDVDLEALINRL